MQNYYLLTKGWIV